VSRLSIFTADSRSTSLRDDKGKGNASLCIRWLVEGTAGPPSTSLRAGSPLGCAPVGMTIHILGRRCECPRKNCHREKSHNLSGQALFDFAPTASRGRQGRFSAALSDDKG
jgi:hypothetical protein